MKTPSVWIVLTIGMFGSVADAADLVTVRQGQPGRTVVRIADQELGYSVLHDTGSSSRGYRVHLTCTMDESFAQTSCPTVRYHTSCPKARIVCQ